MKTKIRALLLVLVLTLTMATGAWAAGTGSEQAAGARLHMTAEYRAGYAVVTVYLEGGEGVTNGRLTVAYDHAAATWTSARVLGSFGASSVNGETDGEVSLAWVGSNLTAENTAMVELTFRANRDVTFAAKGQEVYAGEAKQTVEEAAVTLAYNPFLDIEKHWAKKEILKAYHAGLFRGVSETQFAPEGKMERAMFVTVLYRLAGSPAVENLETAFTDVDMTQYYGTAVAWAAETGVTTGVSETRFAPHQSISRQELVTMLYRYAKVSGRDVAGRADLDGFQDAGKVADWAKEAMTWAVDGEILQGYPEGYLLPRGNATRAQAAAIFCRYEKL